MEWTGAANSAIGFLAGLGVAAGGIGMFRARSAFRGRQRVLELATVAAHLPDVIGRFDTQHRCMFVSSRIEELTGRPPAFFVGKMPEEFGMDAILAARWRAVLDDVIRNKRTREFDYSEVDQHGAERFFITRAVPYFDDNGMVDAVFTIATDNTQRELTARQLQANGMLLEKADMRKNEYLATLAHELRGPLAPISSAVQLLKLSPHRPMREKAREIIERQVAQLSELVNDLMEVGRISSGKLDIDIARVSAQKVIEQALESARPLLDAKRQPLTAALPDKPIWLEGDALRLTQVFTNLLTNASKYSPAGAAVAVDARLEGMNVVVHVRDQGNGMTEASMADIFDLFVQVHATGVQAQGGLGIGLNLVKKIVELHKGQVAVSSAGLNQGSCFTVTLPVAASQVAAEELPEAMASVTAPLTVLIVDDNVDGATTLASLLEALGHEAVTVFNGNDAVAVAAERSLDMAFVDLGLPDISGIQVALRIRGTPSGRKLPLVALTGLGRDNDRYMTQAARFDEHIVKPLQMADLLRITENVVSKRQDAGASIC